MDGENITHPLAYWGHRLLQCLGDFWQWWTTRLQELLPQQVRSRLLVQKQILSIHLGQGHYRLIMQPRDEYLDLTGEPTRKQAQLLAQMREKADHIQLCLPITELLHTCITLPAATADQMQNVLTFEMDKHTPFPAREVYFGYQILERKKSSATIQVALLLVPKKQLDPLFDRLGALHLTPSRIVCPELSESLAIPLSITENDAANRTRKLRTLNGTLVLVMLFLLIAVPLYHRQAKIERLTAQLETPRIRAERVVLIRRQLDELQQSRRFLSREKAIVPPVLMLLDELTRLLPDHTWLQRLQIQQSQVELRGESANASELIALIEDSPLFFDVHFIAPITSNPATSKERFVVNASFGTRGAP